jgi:hypothetical protein
MGWAVSKRYTTGDCNTHDDSWVYEDGIFWLHAGSREKAQRIAAALNAQAGVVEALEKLSITLDLVDKYDLSKNVPWPVAELVREARAALAAIKGEKP